MTTFYKNPADTVDYEVDWEDALGSDTITGSSWAVPTGLTLVSESFTDTSAFIFLSGGLSGSFYTITNTITTSGGDTLTQSFILVCNPVTSSSGVSIFNVTRNDIIRLALEDIRAYAPDFENPPPAAVARASKRLNMMIKAWQASGVGLWLNTIYTMPLVASQESYLLGPDGNPPIPRPLSVVEARVVDTGGNELVMRPISRDEYMALPLKSSTGKPVQYYVDAQLGNQVFYIWPTSANATDVIKMTVRTPVQDFTATDDYPDFPIEWSDALHYSLAMRLIPVYNVNAKISADIKEMAAITLQDAGGFDREQNVSIYFTPEGN